MSCSHKKKTAIILTLLAVLAVSAGMYMLSSQYLTKQFRTHVQPRLEAYTGLQISIESVAVYPFNLLVEAKGVRISNPAGVEPSVLSVDKVRVYFDLVPLISRGEVLIDYLWVSGAKLKGDLRGLGMITSSIKGSTPYTYDKKDKKEFALKFGIRRILLEELGFDLRDSSGGIRLISGDFRIIGEGDSKRPYQVEVEPGDILVRYRDRLEIPTRLSGNFSLLSGDRSGINLNIKTLRIQALGSQVDFQGDIFEERVDINLKANILMDSINTVLGLKGPSGGSVSATGVLVKKTSEEDLGLNLKLSGDGYIENLFESLGILTVVQGHVLADARVYVSTAGVQADGEILLEDGNILTMDEANLKTHFHYGGLALDFSGGTGEIIGGIADEVSVGLVFGKKVDYKVKCRVSDVDSIRLFRMIGWTPPHSQGRITGYVEVAGTAGDNSSIKLTGLANYKSDGIGTALYEKVTQATAGFALDGGILSLEPVTLFGPSAEAKVAGRVDLGRKRLAIDFTSWGNDIAELVSDYYHGLNGAFRVDGRVDGPFTSPLVAGHASLTKGSVAGVEFNSMDGDINFLERRLGVDHAILRAGDAMIDGIGTVSFSGKGLSFFNDFHLQVGADIRKLDPNPILTALGVKGDIFDSSTVSGKISMSGNFDIFRLDLKINSGNGTLYGQSYDRMDLDLKVEEGEIKLRGFEAKKNRSVLRAYGNIIKKNFGTQTESGYCLNFTGSDIYLDDVDLLPDKLNGRVTINTQCSKDNSAAKNINGTGAFRIHTLSYRDVDLGGGELKLKLSGDRLSLDGTVINGLCRLEGWTLLSNLIAKKPVWSINAFLKQSDYTHLIVPFFDEELPPKDLSLVGGGRLSSKKSLGEDISVNAEIEGLSLKAYNTLFKADKPVVLALKGRKLTFESFSLRKGESRFEINGGLVLGRKYDFSMDGKLDLVLLGRLFPTFTSLRGDGRIDLGVTGPWNDPEVAGNLYLKGVSLALKDMPGRLSSLTGQLFFKENRLSIQSLNANWGGGRIEMTGTGVLEKFTLRDFHFEVAASNVSLRPTKDLYVLFDGQVYLDGRDSGRLINGNILFKKAVYRGRVDYKTWLKKARRKEALAPKKSWLGKTELNLHITGEEDHIRVENNIARARLKADLYLKGTIAKPGLLGWLEADTGKIFFRSHEFKILTGNADFIDSHRFNPTLNVSAETWIQGYLVRLNLEGPMDQFKMTLYADDPNLSETDILALLTVGTVGKKLENMGENIGAAEAASFLAGDLQDTIEKRFISLTGFDRFQLDPHVNKTLGTMGPRLTVSKKLLSDKLFVTYSADIGTTEGQSVQLEYHLTRDVSLIGQRDELGATGADIRVHFNFD